MENLSKEMENFRDVVDSLVYWSAWAILAVLAGLSLAGIVG